MKHLRGFTFIELTMVIAILGILTFAFMGNSYSSLKKGRDVARKTDLSQIQRAIEMYYEDKRVFPTSISFGNKLCETANCAGGEKVYMQKLPNETKAGYNYVYNSDGTYYKLYSFIENDQDQGNGVNQAGYAGTDCGGSTLCKYGISSQNTTP